MNSKKNICANFSSIFRKTIIFDAFRSVQNANINRLVRVPLWSIFQIVMVKRQQIQWFPINWEVKCSAFVAIHHQKVLLNCTTTIKKTNK